MSVKIITDSAYDIPEGMEEGLNIGIISLKFRFGLEEFMDRSMSMKNFIERINQFWPTTSAPAPGEYIQAFKESLKTYEKVICITVSSKHSASFSSAVLAGQQFPKGAVTVVDSESLSLGQGHLVFEAAREALQGASVEKIIARLKELKKRLHLFIALDTIENLVKGGRADQITGFLAGLFKIRPILTVVNGQLTLVSKQVGRQASIRKLLEFARRRLPAEKVMVAHIHCLEEAVRVMASFAEKTGFKEMIPVVEPGMVLAVHGGPGTLGILVITQS